MSNARDDRSRRPVLEGFEARRLLSGATGASSLIGSASGFLETNPIPTTFAPTVPGVLTLTTDVVIAGATQGRKH